MTGTDIVLPVLNGECVLVVEPGEDAAASLTALLRLNGFDARAVQTGTAAVAATATMRPRVVIVDLGIKDLDAYEVIRRIRSETNPPAVIVLSARIAATAKQAAEEAGAAEYFLKPADPDALINRVRVLCDECRTH
jgi:DNA-binding response OmpR family regulator